MQSSCKIQIHDKNNNPWQNLYYIPYHPSTYVSQRAFRGLILASLFDIGCDTDFATYSSLYSMSNKLTFLLITFCVVLFSKYVHNVKITDCEYYFYYMEKARNFTAENGINFIFKVKPMNILYKLYCRCFLKVFFYLMNIILFLFYFFQTHLSL